MDENAPKAARGPYKRNKTGEVLAARPTAIRFAPSVLQALRGYADAHAQSINQAANELLAVALKVETSRPVARAKTPAVRTMTPVEVAANRLVGDARFHGRWPLNVSNPLDRQWVYARAEKAGFPRGGDRTELLSQISRLVETLA